MEASDVKQGSVWLAFPVGPELAARLQVPGGTPPEKMHLTLAFLGAAAARDDWSELQERVATFAASERPLAGYVVGTDLFENEDGRPFFATVSVPGLEDLRERLVAALEPPFAVSRDYDSSYNPHITLKLLEPGEPRPRLDFPPLPFACESLVLALGQERRHIDLGGPKVASLEGAPEAPPEAPLARLGGTLEL